MTLFLDIEDILRTWYYGIELSLFMSHSQRDFRTGIHGLNTFIMMMLL